MEATRATVYCMLNCGILRHLSISVSAKPYTSCSHLRRRRRRLRPVTSEKGWWVVGRNATPAQTSGWTGAADTVFDYGWVVGRRPVILVVSCVLGPRTTLLQGKTGAAENRRDSAHCIGVRMGGVCFPHPTGPGLTLRRQGTANCRQGLIFLSSQAMFWPRVCMVLRPSSSCSTSPLARPMPRFQ